MKPNMIYSWEMQTKDGNVLKQYEKDGKENTWKTLDPDQVVRISFIPAIKALPQHDIFIDHSKGEKFVRRFGRGFIKARWQFQLGEYVNCIVTNRYRFWVFSSGRVMITNVDHEVYI